MQSRLKWSEAITKTRGRCWGHLGGRYPGIGGAVTKNEMKRMGQS